MTILVLLQNLGSLIFKKKNLCRFLSITAEEVGYFRKEMKTHTQISIVQGWADLPPQNLCERLYSYRVSP